MEHTEVTSMYESQKQDIVSKSTDKAYLDINVNKNTNKQKHKQTNTLKQKFYEKKHMTRMNNAQFCLIYQSLEKKEVYCLDLSSYDFFVN